MDSPRAFYDDFVRKLLRDYATGNERMERAVAFALEAVPVEATEVLDVGCGIGWSSAEIARHRPNARVIGADLSPRLVETARALFGKEDRLEYQVRNFIEEPIEGRFDAVVLLDVYEHFPVGDRSRVHERLDKLMKETGALVLAVPTPDHQRYLREDKPDGLQPVDEDVGREDLERLARDVGGRLAELRAHSVWRPGKEDYYHAVILRGTGPQTCATDWTPEKRPDRERRVQEAFGIRCTESGAVLAARDGPPVCVAAPAVARASETFIGAHLERLPTTVELLYGSPRPHRTASGRSLLPFPLRAAAGLLGRLFRQPRAPIEDRLFCWLPAGLRARLYARYLRRHRIRAVLAEYGSVAVGFRAGCRRAGVPLVPHFHGFDAFVHEILAEHGAAYRAMFADGHPVVAVSESMKRQLVSLGADKDQVHVIPCGADAGAFKPGRPQPGSVLAVGRLVDKKAPDLVVLAFQRALEHVPEARLTIVGDGPLLPSVARLVAGLGLEDRITLAGAQGHAAVADLMASAALFVQHSVIAPNGDREGTPVSVIEAGAAGVPVVATRHEGIADVVADGETGVLVDAGDVDGMGRAIADLLADRERAVRLGAAARARIEAEYSLERSIDRLWGVLRRAMDA